MADDDWRERRAAELFGAAPRGGNINDVLAAPAVAAPSARFSPPPRTATPPAPGAAPRRGMAGLLALAALLVVVIAAVVALTLRHRAEPVAVAPAATPALSPRTAPTAAAPMHDAVPAAPVVVTPPVAPAIEAPAMPDAAAPVAPVADRPAQRNVTPKAPRHAADATTVHEARAARASRMVASDTPRPRYRTALPADEVAAVDPLAADPSALPVVVGRIRPSFNCARAQGDITRAICTDRRLATLDRRLARRFADLDRSVDPATIEALHHAETSFLNARQSCGDTECLAAAYRTRLDELDAIQK